MDYQKHYNNLIDRARDRELECYTESHHVIPRCMGGDDSKTNLVNLTAEEHYIAHLLLVKIHPEHHGLVWAAIQMTGHPSGQRSSNKMYGWLRRKYQSIAKAGTGEKNGATGTMWINKIGTTENRKIRKDEHIPEGWEKGRKIRTKPKNPNSYCSCGNIKKIKAAICIKCYKVQSDSRFSSKLNWNIVRDIRRKYESGQYTQDALAFEYNVSQPTIFDIVNWNTWKQKDVDSTS